MGVSCHLLGPILLFLHMVSSSSSLPPPPPPPAAFWLRRGSPSDPPSPAMFFQEARSLEQSARKRLKRQAFTLFARACTVHLLSLARVPVTTGSKFSLQKRRILLAASRPLSMSAALRFGKRRDLRHLFHHWLSILSEERNRRSEKHADERRPIIREWRLVAHRLLPFKGITLRHAFGHILMLRAVSRGHGYLVHGMLKSYWFIWRGGITNDVNARRMDCEYFPRLVRLCRPTGVRKDSEMTQCTELEYQNAFPATDGH